MPIPLWIAIFKNAPLPFTPPVYMVRVMAREIATIDDVIDQLGGTSAVARLTGRPAQAVSNWRRRGKAPPEAYLIISRALSERGLSVPLHVLGMDEPPMEKSPPDPEAPRTGDRGAMN